MRWILQSRRILAVAIVGLALSVVTETAVLAASITNSGKAVTAVRTATDNSDYFTASTTPVDMPSMSVSVSVPSNQKAILVITFSAQSHCTTASGAFCWVRVIVDGSSASPGDIAFGSGVISNFSSQAWQANSMQFTAGPLASGSHTVSVKWWESDDDGQGDFRVESRTLTVLRSRV